MFHELATNSTKYGVLSGDEGTVDVAISHAGDESLRIVWREPGVPRYEQETEGFGSRLLRMSVEGQLQGTIEREWDDDGMSVTLDLSLPVLAG